MDINQSYHLTHEKFRSKMNQICIFDENVRLEEGKQ
jgi:hypothetical protein